LRRLVEPGAQADEIIEEQRRAEEEKASRELLRTIQRAVREPEGCRTSCVFMPRNSFFATSLVFQPISCWNVGSNFR
jgi:hypothetical protein